MNYSDEVLNRVREPNVTAERVMQKLDLPAERHHVARMAVEAGRQAVRSAFAANAATADRER